MTDHRITRGGRIDRSRQLRFQFDGQEFTGYAGDTLTSALLAQGQLELAPSIYRDRPRGPLTAGSSEPNVFVELGTGTRETMLPAPCVDLVDGLVAEPLAGVGVLSREPESAEHDTKFVHADVVVIGGGPAGVAATVAAGRSGARVLLVEEDPSLGGSCEDGPEQFDDLVHELCTLPEVRVLTRSTAVGLYDHNYLLVAQRPNGWGQGGQRMWHVRARSVVLATGARERPIVFADNDRPGIMLASAVSRYLHRFAVLPGRNPVVFTTTDSAYRTAVDLAAHGANVSIVDARPEPAADLVALAHRHGVRVRLGCAVYGTSGRGRVESVRIAGIDGDGRLSGMREEFGCDLVAVSGGWNPAVELHHQVGGALAWDATIAGFVPVRSATLPAVVGAAAGTFDTGLCMAQGVAAGAAAAGELGYARNAPDIADIGTQTTGISPLWCVPGGNGGPAEWDTHFVDLARDATVSDIRRAIGAGMRSVEHVKRYTSIGTGSDQGKTASVNAIGIVAHLLGAASPGEIGVPSHRPPGTPVSFALMAGRGRGHLHDPVRMTPMHQWHVDAGAEFENVGQWKRPWYYPRPGEDMSSAVRRECRAARTGVAMMDATTLGKIEIVGADAPEFLNRIYTNGFAKLAVGKARYGMMCGADGMVLDDGVAMRLAEDHYLMSTTTGNAATVLDWLEQWLQTEWPHLAVHCTSVTEQWATIAVVGPRSRAVIARIAPDLDVSAEAFGFMEVRETVLRDGIEARICRISFSGELAYEINVASWFGLAVWLAVGEAGADFGITPYGTETMHVLRAEKGFVIVGQDTDGTVTPYDLGMDWVVSRRKDFIGRRSLARSDTQRGDRKHLVGLLPIDRSELLPEGAQLVDTGVSLDPPVPMLGHVTSSYHSEALGRTFALALMRSGRDRIGERVAVVAHGRSVTAEISAPVFYDPEGQRRDGAPATSTSQGTMGGGHDGH